MYCNKCGAQIDTNTNFCNKCGNQLNNTIPIQPIEQPIQQTNYYPQPNNKSGKKWIILGASLGGALLLIIIIAFIAIISKSSSQYYFSGNGYDDDDDDVIVEKKEDPKEEEEPPKVPREYMESTVIETEHRYDIVVSGAEEARALISKDSIDQKSKCPQEILAVENDLINNYGITAVNLCEMDVDYARNMIKAFKEIYNEYPNLRGYLTNISLTNSFDDSNTYACFYGWWWFISSDIANGKPGISKTQIYLASRWFLNEDIFEKSLAKNSSSGFHPKNHTSDAVVAHELGHFISTVAAARHYGLDSLLLWDENTWKNYKEFTMDRRENRYSQEILHEAHENYQRDKNVTVDFDEWRATISQYAVTKNNEGVYLYDETIAEAVSDVYANGYWAADASKYIVEVLKSRLRN